MQAQEIYTLRNLVRMNLDAADGLYTAAGSVNDTPMKTFLTRCAQLRKNYARMLTSDLDNEVDANMTDADDTFVHGMWQAVRSSTYKFNPAAILKECRQAEEYILNAYDEALHMNLPGSIRKSLLRQQKNITDRYHQMVGMIGQFEGWISGPFKVSGE